MRRMNPDPQGKWGIMGGVFDPIHYGHLVLAECACQAFTFSGVLFVVSYNPPHREQKPSISFEDRIEMTALGTEDNEIFAVSDLEKTLEGPGYTLAIVKSLREKYPDADWHLILGADNIAVFDSWHKPEELAQQAKIVVANRPGYDREFEQSKWHDRVKKFRMPLLEISSTMIRQSIKENRSVRYLMPEKVWQFIRDKGLYK